EAMTIWNDLIERFPNEARLRRELLAETYFGRGNLRADAHQLTAARDDFRETVKLLTSLHQTDPGYEDYRFKLASAQSALGAVQIGIPPLDAAQVLALFQKAIDLWKPLMNQFGHVAVYRQGLADTLVQRGTLNVVVFQQVPGEQKEKKEKAAREAEDDLKE